MQKSKFISRTLLLIFCLTGTSLSAQKLSKAVAAHDFAKAKLLLEQGAKTEKHDKKGLFPLWTAVVERDTAMVRLLLEFKADPNFKTRNEYPISAIVIPLQEGYLDVLKILVEYGINIKSATFRGQTPIRVATRNGHLDIIKYLVEKGADFDDHSAKDGATPLEGAAAKGHLHLVKYFVEKGANLNHQDAEGDTPIGEAAINGHLDVVEFLFSQGANPLLKNKKEEDAIFRAKIGGHSDIAAWLKEKLSAKKGR